MLGLTDVIQKKVNAQAYLGKPRTGKALAEVANGIHMGERGTDPNE